MAARDQSFAGLPSHVLVLAACAFLLIGGLRLVGGLEHLELMAYDLGLHVQPERRAEPPVIVVEETEADLHAWGHPLSDEVLARVVARLAGYAPRAIGVDKIRDVPVEPGSDELDALLAAEPRVAWVYQLGGQGGPRIDPPRSLRDGSRTGFGDVLLDAGGIVRRGLLYADDADGPRPSLPLVLALAWLEGESIVPAPDARNPDVLCLAHACFPMLEADSGPYAGTDSAGYQVLLDYRTDPARIPHVSLGEVLSRDLDPAWFRDKVVLVGATAESLKDYFHTPIDERHARSRPIAGAELHAALVSQLVAAALGEPAGVTVLPKVAEYALAAALCLAGIIGWYGRGPLAILGLAGGGLAAVGGVWFACARNGIAAPLVPVAGGYLVSLLGNAGLRFAHEIRLRREIMGLFTRHVSPEVAAELWARRAELLDGRALRPTALEAVVLFADIRGYSTLAEVHTAEETANWLNTFMGAMADTIMQHRGVVRQYAGDEVMAIFGAPVPSTTPDEHSRDIRAAVNCAVAMCRRLAELNDGWREAGLPTVGMRVGIHAGPMVGCTIGSASRIEYTVVGDAVNVAARLQALNTALPGAEPDPCRILISEAVHSRLPASVSCVSIGIHDVKGRKDRIAVYRVAYGEARAAG